MPTRPLDVLCDARSIESALLWRPTAVILDIEGRLLDAIRSSIHVPAPQFAVVDPDVRCVILVLFQSFRPYATEAHAMRH
jgi:hypothetical protein